MAFGGQHYQVVRVFEVETEEVVEVEVFSSETSAWSHCWSDSSASGMGPPEAWICSSLYLDRAIHWELGGYLLAYLVCEGRCQLIEL